MDTDERDWRTEIATLNKLIAAYKAEAEEYTEEVGKRDEAIREAATLLDTPSGREWESAVTAWLALPVVVEARKAGG